MLSSSNSMRFPERPDRGAVAARVTSIIAAHLCVPNHRVTPAARIVEDLGADSFGKVELIIAFEDEFGIAVSDTEATRIVTVGDAIACALGGS